MEEIKNAQQKASNWIKNSITLKLIVITILMLLLLIPSGMIQGIIYERRNLHDEAVREVSNKWAGEQEINGPILTIPVIVNDTKHGKIIRNKEFFHILPEQLNIDGEIDPQSLKRGIHEVVVYKSLLDVNGTFKLNKPIHFDNTVHKIEYDKAFLTIGISDLRGIEDNIVVAWNKHNLNVEPGSRIPNIIRSGVTVELPSLMDSLKSAIPFGLKIDLKGSQNLSMIPLGNVTSVDLSSSWQDPSFNGNFLPDTRNVTEAGFAANWKVLQLNRNYPQTWKNNEYNHNTLRNSGFGLDLILPVDDYQKSIRSSKYAVMMIALTFLIFFLVEIMNKRKIHPFQYILVGLGLCLFYTLLVSLSEHIEYNLAYLIAALTIIGMISIYSISVFQNKKFTILLSLTLSGIYGFLFVTLQMTDYALLMGSVGLTAILATTMYFTRNINWYNLSMSND